MNGRGLMAAAALAALGGAGGALEHIGPVGFAMPQFRKRLTSHRLTGAREPRYSAAAGAVGFAVQRSGMRVPISVVFSRGMRRNTSSR